MGALQLVLGLMCLAVTVVAVVLVVRTVRRMVSSIRLGQPDPTRKGPFGARFGNMLTEILGHTRMLKWSHVGVAHWFVMLGFLGLSVTVAEAYGEVFVPGFEFPWLGSFGPWNLVVEILGITTILGGLWLIAVRQLNHPRRAGRVSRFQGSNFWQAYFVEAVVVLEGVGIMGLRSFKHASGLMDAPTWSAPISYALGSVLPASTAAVSVFAAFKILSAMIWVIVIASNITMGVAWHRFTAFFNIFFKREADGQVALGAGGELGPPLDGDHVGGQVGQQRGLVAAPGADLQDVFGAGQHQPGQHLGRQRRLGADLAVSDGHRDVGIGALGQELGARHGAQRGEHALVGHSRTTCRVDQFPRTCSHHRISASHHRPSGRPGTTAGRWWACG